MDDYARAYADSSDRLVRAAFLILRDADLAADVVADAFARSYPAWRDQKIGDLTGYLYRAVVNRSLSARRRVSRVAHLDVPPTMDGPDPAEALADRDRLNSALAALPTRQRAVLVLRFYCDLSEADIAATLGIPAGTVKSTTARALDRLRATLKEGTNA